MRQDFGYQNNLAVPKITKVCINIGIGQFSSNPKFVANLDKELKKITGQKPVLKKARKAISGFKVRQGQIVAMAVTLRGQRMYNFIERLIYLVLPRIRDFRGLELSGFDNCGNYSLGFKEQIVFPEIKFEEADIIHGLQINISTSAKNRQISQNLLQLMGFPFKKTIKEKKSHG